MTIVRWLPPNGGGEVKPGQRRELRPHAVQREILNLAEAARLALEHEVADRHRARVEAHDERTDRARRHEGARAVHVADGLRQRLGHVGAGWNVSFSSDVFWIDFDSTLSMPLM